MRLLILDNYDSFTYNLVQLIEEAGCTSYSVCKNDEVTLEEVHSFDKILLSPGPGIPSEAGILCELVRNFAAKKDILGICLGHQAIAEVFGGSLYRYRQVQHGIREEIEVVDKEESLFSNVNDRFQVGLYHSWAVEASSLPASLKVTAVSNKGVIMAISHKKYKLKGLQFHPESIMTPHGAQILKNWLEDETYYL